MVKSKYISLFIVGLLLVACAAPPTPPDGPDTEVNIKIVNLAQGWNEQTQLDFWFTSQGSQIMPYRWFLALEQSGNQELLRSDKNMRRLGYLPSKNTSGGRNPDSLPIGFAKTFDDSGADWIGLTCAACHTTQINYKGVGLQIDGGPTLADFNTFYRELVGAMSATLADSGKFTRFANLVLGNCPTPTQLSALRESLTQLQSQNEARYKLNMPRNEPGYGRLDAFGNIFNQALVTALDQPTNARSPDAPVSYPFLWDTPQHDVVQWNGSAPNGPLRLGELGRNTGEVVGVFGGLKITSCDLIRCKYSHNVDLINLGKLESWVRRLWSPQWDSTTLGSIDQTLAQQGKIHYDKYCAACHAIIDRTDSLRKITAVITDVGTDPGMATAGLIRISNTGPLKGKIKPLSFNRFGATLSGTALLENEVAGILASDIDTTLRALSYEYQNITPDRAVKDVQLSLDLPPSREEVIMALSKYASTHEDTLEPRMMARAIDQPQSFSDAHYKARPLNGIWATAPYLHNGSVPSLWALLQTSEQRPKIFFVGSRDFDPKDVGFVSDSGPYRFDVSLLGNSNAGHQFGSQELSDMQKRQLLEYLKTL